MKPVICCASIDAMCPNECLQPLAKSQPPRTGLRENPSHAESTRSNETHSVSQQPANTPESTTPPQSTSLEIS